MTNYYYAYHSKENKEPFDNSCGYGFSEASKNKQKKVNLGDFVYIIQKPKHHKNFSLAGKYQVIDKYQDDKTKRKYRLRLKDCTKLNEPIAIDEKEWSKQLPTFEGGNEGWSNFKKHFCRTGVSCQSPLSKELRTIIESHLTGGDDTITSALETDIKEISRDTTLSETEKKQLIDARIGQGRFKKNVRDTWGRNCCSVTSCEVEEILIASHIKGWKQCETNKERLDGANGLLLAAHIDKLFDRHLITFKLQGGEFRLTVSHYLKHKYGERLNELGLKTSIPLNVSYLDKDKLRRFTLYMAHHNVEFDKKTAKDQNK